MYAPCVPHRTAVPTEDLALASRFSIKHSIILQGSKGDTFVGRDFGFGVSTLDRVFFFEESDSVYQNAGR